MWTGLAILAAWVLFLLSHAHRAPGLPTLDDYQRESWDQLSSREWEELRRTTEDDRPDG